MALTKTVWRLTGDFRSQLSEYETYWRQWLKAYVGQARRESDPEKRRRVISSGFEGLRINILAREEGYRYPHFGVGALTLLRQAAEPAAGFTNVRGLWQLCGVRERSDEAVFVTSDLQDPALTAFHELEARTFVHFEVDDPEAKTSAQKRYALRTAQKSALQELDSVRTAPRKTRGRLLEAFLAGQFGSVPGFSVLANNLRNATEELDLVIQNNSDAWPWSQESPLLLVECKNWSTAVVGVKDFKVFVEKLANRFGRSNLGFLVTTGSFSRAVRAEALRHSRSTHLVLLLDSADLDRLAGTVHKAEILADIYRRAVTL